MAAQEKHVPGKAEILIQVPERLGGKVIEAKGLSKAYGDKLLFEDLSFTLPPGGTSLFIMFISLKTPVWM